MHAVRHYIRSDLTIELAKRRSQDSLASLVKKNTDKQITCRKWTDNFTMRAATTHTV